MQSPGEDGKAPQESVLDDSLCHALATDNALNDLVEHHAEVLEARQRPVAGDLQVVEPHERRLRAVQHRVHVALLCRSHGRREVGLAELAEPLPAVLQLGHHVLEAAVEGHGCPVLELLWRMLCAEVERADALEHKAVVGVLPKDIRDRLQKLLKPFVVLFLDVQLKVHFPYERDQRHHLRDISLELADELRGSLREHLGDLLGGLRPAPGCLLATAPAAPPLGEVHGQLQRPAGLKHGR
mmetsp:Transcript_25413/g.71084  ORF Transcript_25413/g.71084 Transcript_25413/m.71084 type:complete len:240 (+) Transcript_25413:1347-2066(+)